MEREKRDKRDNRCGFTLIELLVASTVLVLIGAAVLTTFASGFHVYERVQTYGGVQAEALLALEGMQRDISNTFLFSQIPFEGDAGSIAFPSIIEAFEAVDGKEKAVSTLGQVVYTLSVGEDRKVLTRDAWDYARVGAQEKDLEDGGFVAFVEDLKLRYYYFDAEDEQYAWKADWTEEDAGLPAAVEIALTFEARGRDITLTRTALIPSRHAGQQQEDDGGEDGEGEEEDGLPEEDGPPGP